MAYITYAEFIELGGKDTVNETAFSSLIFKAEAKLNRLTNGRIAQMEKIPDAVKQLDVDVVNLLSSVDYNSTSNLTSYSNGIESFGYAGGGGGSTGSAEMEKRIYAMAKEYLWEYPYLLYRGVMCRDRI